MHKYLEHLKACGLAENTIRNTKSVIKNFQGRELIEFLSEPKRTPDTLCQRYSILKLYYDWLEKTGVIFVHPMKNIKRPKRPVRLPKNIITTGEVQKVLSVFPDDPKKPWIFQCRVMLELMYSCSLRRSELVALNIESYDKKRRILKVSSPKTKTSRETPVGLKAAVLLEQYFETQCDNQVPMFLGPDRKDRIKLFWITNLTREARIKSGIRTKASSHSLRKSSATHMLKNGAPVQAVQRLLGHKSLTTTTIYTKVYNKDLVKMFSSYHPRERMKNLGHLKLEVPIDIKS